MTISLQVEERTNQTKGELNRLRREGKIPGVVYGKQIHPSTALSIDEKQLLALLRTQPNAVLEIEVPNSGKQPVMVGEVQRDALSRSVLHIDFHQIDMNEEVKTAVRIEVTGESIGVKEGGILQLMLHELEVVCLPSQIPDALQVDVSNLNIGENLLAEQLRLPKGVLSRTEPDQVVVTVLAPQKELEEEEAVAEDQASEAAEERAEEARLNEFSASE